MATIPRKINDFMFSPKMKLKELTVCSVEVLSSNFNEELKKAETEEFL